MEEGARRKGGRRGGGTREGGGGREHAASSHVELVVVRVRAAADIRVLARALRAHLAAERGVLGVGSDPETAAAKAGGYHLSAPAHLLEEVRRVVELRAAQVAVAAEVEVATDAASEAWPRQRACLAAVTD